MQIIREELADMTPEQIVTAKRERRLNSLLGREVTVNELLDVIERRERLTPKPTETAPAEGELTREDLDGMSPEEIVSAKRAGHLDALLGRTQ
jgi:hypothetical protein